MPCTHSHVAASAGRVACHSAVPHSLTPSAALLTLSPSVMSSDPTGVAFADSVESVAAPSHAELVSSSSFSTPRFQSLEWRLDVQRHSNSVSDMATPAAIVQIRTQAANQSQTAAATATAPSQLVQFEMDRSTAANVLLQLEKIEAIMAGAQ